VQNEELRNLPRTTNRTLPTGLRIGVADALRYEKATGQGIPDYSHIVSGLDVAGLA
jgi:hypothetical protein